MQDTLEELKGDLICPYCGNHTRLQWVHGHGQCSTCKTNVDECCRGEQCESPVDHFIPEHKTASKQKL